MNDDMQRCPTCKSLFSVSATIRDRGLLSYPLPDSYDWAARCGVCQQWMVLRLDEDGNMIADPVPLEQDELSR